MIDLIFTLDYEIFGNGDGSLYECILKNTEALNKIFENYNFRYVNYVEVAELIKIKEYNSDPDVKLVEDQILSMYHKEYEIGLHLHPQWFNSKFINNRWELDYNEYNMCMIERYKIDNYFEIAIQYLKEILMDSKFNPISFRAGNWLIQPTNQIIDSLIKHHIKIDSSVFKGGVLRNYNIDFRNALKNGYYWLFHHEVNLPTSKIGIWEIPIYSWMVPFWKSINKNKYEALKKHNNRRNAHFKKLINFVSKINFLYPLKMDFTKMSFYELKEILLKIIETDNTTPHIYKPITLIGHSKNNIKFSEIENFLNFISLKNINVVLFKDIISKLEKNYNP